ncbi:hypothetical protein F7P74_09125 [Helicobacter pullorum NCTC 12824]|uniref:hypothetical protein n=1 Tax=Helicobacter pullorum TaxID=35818 RepID=UPI001247A260|nr:hypothetical protein [Helicobacter pullorum]KAB0573850.1 hypothetical protein F7P74_09125 [Helicobacter pullorum NCTC 12824]
MHIESLLVFSGGSDFELMPFLGIQIVSGQNYAFICRRKSVTLHPISTYSLVICYKDLGGNCEITKIKDVVKDSKCPLGGIVCTKDSEAFITQLDSIEANHILQAFNKALCNVIGVKYSPILYIAYSISRGINYHIIARSTISDKDQTIGCKHIVINYFMETASIVSIEEL